MSTAADAIRAYLRTAVPDIAEKLFQSELEDIVGAVWPIINAEVRGQVAADIRAALKADEADPDVSSGEAIWEQGGYRNGLRDAAGIAEGDPHDPYQR